jgi:hypothetical protein
MKSRDYESEYQEVARLQYGEIERLRAMVKQRDAEIAAMVDWIASDQDALSALRAAYIDPRSRAGDKIRAAASALPFERSKPASVVVQIDFRERVKASRLHTVELRKAEWARQEPLDLDAPTPATILGGDREGEALGPDSAA